MNVVSLQVILYINYWSLFTVLKSSTIMRLSVFLLFQFIRTVAALMCDSMRLDTSKHKQLQHLRTLASSLVEILKIRNVKSRFRTFRTENNVYQHFLGVKKCHTSRSERTLEYFKFTQSCNVFLQVIFSITSWSLFTV